MSMSLTTVFKKAGRYFRDLAARVAVKSLLLFPSRKIIYLHLVKRGVR